MSAVLVMATETSLLHRFSSWAGNGSSSMTSNMDLQGSIEANLVVSIRSARRLSGHPIHADTLQHWTNLLHRVRRQLSAQPASEAETLAQLIAELETELANRSR